MSYNLTDYFTGKKRRLSYSEAVDAYDFLRFHFDGPPRRYFNQDVNGQNTYYPCGDAAMERVLLQLIHNRRPSETIEIWQYRKTIFEPRTKETTSAVLRSLSKIKRSPDYTIKYPTEKVASISEDETLEQYCEYHYPNYQSVTNWAFEILLKNLLIDPNAVCLIQPLKKDVQPNEYLKPYPTIFNSNQVFEYIEDELAVLQTVERTDKGGQIFLVVTPEYIERHEQIGTSTDYLKTESYPHGLGKMPCFKLPGIYKKSFDNDYLNESHISGMVPSLNEAARIYSDYQAELVMHIFSEKWEYSTQKCEECYGSLVPGLSTGWVKSGKKTVVCTKCNGTGLMGSAPYKKYVLSSTVKLDEKAMVPTPPAGYIEKSTEIAKLLAEVVDTYKYAALSAINMQFLADTPLNQSGKAKEVDKDELNNFVYSIASAIIFCEKKIYYFTNEYRYKTIIPNEKARKEMLPEIPVPQKFDILTSNFLLEDIKAARGDAALNHLTLVAFEVDFCAKRFPDQPEVKEELELVFLLDPLPGKTDDEKLTMITAGGVTESDYIISCNINSFVKRAINEDENFFKEEFEEQRAKMTEYATAIQTEISAKQQLEQKQALKMAQASAAPVGN